jgi:uncharacterized lipoprotein YmbA
MKNFIWIISVLFIFGCSSKSYYVLENTQTRVATKINKDIIGVETIELPAYLLQNNIAIGEDQKIKYVKNSYWAVHLDEYLTNRVINTLQKSLQNPNVYNYPWSSSSQKITKKISIKINRFIAIKNKLYLDATWQLKDSKNNILKSTLFNRQKELKNTNTKEIVNMMNTMFLELEESIITNL